jgi:hypothetical protein
MEIPFHKVGKFYNGVNLEKGLSDLALNHAFLLSGVAELPWRFQVSSIFRLQSSFHFSKQADILLGGRRQSHRT